MARTRSETDFFSLSFSIARQSTNMKEEVLDFFSSASPITKTRINKINEIQLPAL